MMMYDDSKARYEERLSQAEYERLVRLARAERASAFARLRMRIAARLRAITRRAPAAAQPAPQFE